MMKPSHYLLALAAVVFAAGCQAGFLGEAGAPGFDADGDGQIVQGNGVEKTEARPVGEFTKIEVSGSINLELEVGAPTRLEVTTDENLLPLVVTETKGDMLKVYRTGSSSTRLGVKVKGAAPKLTAAAAKASSSMNIKGIQGEAFETNLSASSAATLAGQVEQFKAAVTTSSQLKAFDLKAAAVNLTASASSSIEAQASREATAAAKTSSTIRLKGQAGLLSAEASASSRILAYDLTAEVAKVKATSASTVEVTATKELDASASGAGTVQFAGAPAKVVRSVSSAGSVRSK